MSKTRQKIIRDSLHYLSATVIGQGVGLIRSIVIPVIFSPAQLGIWNLMNVILNYGANAHLGILHGMNKAIPFQRGQGNLEEVELTKDSVFWLNLLLAALATGILLLTSLFVSENYALSLRIIAIAVFLLLIFTYLFSLLRADNRFGLISRGVFGLSIISTSLIVLFSLGFTDHLLGALVGLVAAYLIIVMYWYVQGRYQFSYRMSSKSISSVFVLGTPLIISGFLDSVLLSVDRWVLVAKFGETMLGYYAVSIMASNMIALVPSSIASVLYPKMLERYGASGNPAELRGLLAGPMQALAALMSVLIGVSALILPFMIRLYLPKYIPSISLIYILLAAAFFYSGSFLPGNFLVAINRQKILIKIQIVTIILAFILDLVIISMGWGVVGVALITAVVYSIYGCGYMFFAAYFAFEQWNDIISLFAEICGIFTAMIFGLIISINLIPEGTSLGMALRGASMRLVLFGLVLSPVLWWFNRKGKLIEILREFLSTRTTKIHA